MPRQSKQLAYMDVVITIIIIIVVTCFDLRVGHHQALQVV